MFKKIVLISLLIVFTYTLISCNLIDKKSQELVEEDEELVDDSASEQVLSIDPDPRPDEQTLILYFKHRNFDFLVPEERVSHRDNQSWEQLIVEEILKGPEKHDRVGIIPDNMEILDVTRKGETVFLNFSPEFLSQLDLTTIPGKEEVPEEKRALVKADMKRLSIYSIVNSLTELEGVNQIKFLVENKAVSFSDLDDDLESLIFPDMEEGEKGEDDSNAVLMALTRDRSFILDPSMSVRSVFEGLVGEPKWDRVYPLLSREMANKNNLPPKEELERLWAVIVSSIELDEDFIKDEEIKPDGTAFITMDYTVNFTSGKKQVMVNDVIIVKNEDNIWKVRLPEFISELR